MINLYVCHTVTLNHFFLLQQRVQPVGQFMPAAGVEFPVLIDFWREDAFYLCGRCLLYTSPSER